jgi:hypothetical protein
LQSSPTCRWVMHMVCGSVSCVPCADTAQQHESCAACACMHTSVHGANWHCLTLHNWVSADSALHCFVTSTPGLYVRELIHHICCNSVVLHVLLCLRQAAVSNQAAPVSLSTAYAVHWRAVMEASKAQHSSGWQPCAMHLRHIHVIVQQQLSCTHQCHPGKLLFVMAMLFTCLSALAASCLVIAKMKSVGFSCLPVRVLLTRQPGY